MKNRILILTSLLIIFIVNTSVGQTDDSLFYKRMVGTIGKKVNVTTHLIKVHDNLSGNYHYTFVGQDGKKQFGKTIELSGKVINDSIVLLKELGEDDYSFKGKLEDDRFAGVWHDPDDEEKSLPFEMEAYYPNGSFPFSIHYLKSEYFLNKNISQSPSANIELTLAWPSGHYFVPQVIDSVKTYIVKSFFGSDFNKNVPDSMLVTFEQEYYHNFVMQVGELYKKYKKVFNWEKTVSMSVVFNSNYLLTLEYLRYAYSGGNSGIINTSYDVINLRNGKLLDFTSIFKPNTKDTLSKLLTCQIKTDYKIKQNVSLKKAGFFYDTILPNSNIYVNGNGVGFVYNSYEIAPFSQGTITVFLPFLKIKGIIKKGTPVYQLSQQD